MVLVSGIFGGLAHEPSWLSRLASCLPAAPLIHLTSDSLQWGFPKGLDLVDVACLICRLLAGSLTSLVTFRWTPARH